MINRISHRKKFVFNDKNNNKRVLRNIAKRTYTHLLISLEISISKKFKSGVLDRTTFTDCLFLLIHDKIYLVKESGKNF